VRVGVFDSGVGGLSVVKSLLEYKLFNEIIYLGDTARVPYGTKDKNTIIRYSLEALEFFKNFDIDMMITACNSVSAYAIEELRQNALFDIVGVIEPGVRALINRVDNKNAKILIIATKATILSKKYQTYLHKQGYTNTISKATPLFVPLVEEGIFEGKILEETMRYYFHDICEPDICIMGCTHFPLIKKELQKFYPNTLFIHSGEAIVEYLEDKFSLTGDFSKTDLKLFATENPDYLKQVANNWLTHN